MDMDGFDFAADFGFDIDGEDGSDFAGELEAIFDRSALGVCEEFGGDGFRFWGVIRKGKRPKSVTAAEEDGEGDSDPEEGCFAPARLSHGRKKFR